MLNSVITLNRGICMDCVFVCMCGLLYVYILITFYVQNKT